MTRREIHGARAIVTGASSGIGRAVCLELVRDGANVLAVARRQERLKQLVDEAAALPGKVLTLTGDITDPQVRQQTMDAAQTHFGGLDLLINNAGVGAMGRFEDAKPEHLRRIMEVNFFAAAEMIRLALPRLKQGQQPMIINVSSILGRRGVPYSSEYCASKFAMIGLSESLRAELSRHGIDVLVVNPGTTETEFFDSVLESTAAPNWPEHRPVSPAAVARAMVKAIRRGRHEIVPYRWGKVLLWLNRLAPRGVDWLMEKYV